MTTAEQYTATVPVQSPIKPGFASSASIAAAVLLLTVGTLSLFEGIAAVARDDLFVLGGAYTYELDITTWGWIHIVLGALLIAAALGLITGRTWGKVLSIGFLALTIIAHFLSLPYYPWWSTLVIVLSVVPIRAIATWHPQD
ncbi:DUF7144 family membrane protein [Nocardia carnea]|uniref:DUF7144 family membrane protein n=1 Tax=Nocardia carnea TaxID=37328 RepID=UPI002457083E|nr:hypothetical protein [Nocardia carnea]